MASTTSGLTVPAGGDPFDPQGDMVKLANSLRSRIRIPVANQAGRDALLGMIDWTPTGGDPLRVSRGDTAAHEQYDGLGWRTTWLPPLSGSFAVNTGLWNLLGSPSIIRRGTTWFASISLVQKNAGSISTGFALMGTLGPECRHTDGGQVYGGGKVAFPDGPAISVVNRANGEVQMHLPSFTGNTSTTYLLSLVWPAV